MHTYTCISPAVSMAVSVNNIMCVYVCVFIYIHIYIHTHTHISPREGMAVLFPQYFQSTKEICCQNLHVYACVSVCAYVCAKKTCASAILSIRVVGSLAVPVCMYVRACAHDVCVSQTHTPRTHTYMHIHAHIREKETSMNSNRSEQNICGNFHL